MERRPPVLAPHACTEPGEMMSALAAAHDRAVSGLDEPGNLHDPGPGTVRRAIHASWLRSRLAGVDAAVPAAEQVYAEDVLPDVRDRHPLRPLQPMLEGLLRRLTDEDEHLVAIADAAGHILWSDGTPRLRRAADTLGVDGFCWSERTMGTNAIGTTLATGAPQYVFAAEHLASVLHPWSCAAAPIVDPDSGETVGCVDVGGTVRTLHPAAVALVGAVARVAEARLEVRMRCRDELLRERYRHHLDAALRGTRTGSAHDTAALVTGTGRVLLAEPASWIGQRLGVPDPEEPLPLPDGQWARAEPLGEIYLLRSKSRRPAKAATRPTNPAKPAKPADPADAADAANPANTSPRLTLALLGDGPPKAWLGGRQINLSQRHAEILALLAMHPHGLNGDRLAFHLYGDDGSTVTVRAEIHRLRAQLGDVLEARPYRLACDVDADFLEVRRLLRRGMVTRAVRLAWGRLLPLSDAPAIRAEREELTVLLRRRVLEHGDAEALWAYGQTEPGQEDLEVLDRLIAALPPGDPHRDEVAFRRHRLLND
jgi:hypothetical protein